MNKYGITREEEIKEEIRWAEGKINYYVNKIYNRKLKLEKSKQELKSLITDTQTTEEEIIDCITDIKLKYYKIEEFKKDIKRYHEYIEELKEDLK